MSSSPESFPKHTLLLSCVGPLQSWGTRSRFTERDTEREPSKSGVVGLLCAALGAERGEAVAEFNARRPDCALPAEGDALSRPVEEWLGRTKTLRMGVRVDAPGELLLDYHTAQNVARASGKGLAETVLSNRYYLQDAAFLVGLESSNRRLLEVLSNALADPFWPLALGRKACPPGLPVRLPDGGLRDIALDEALKAQPWLLDEPGVPLRLRSRAYRDWLVATDGPSDQREAWSDREARARTNARLTFVIENGRYADEGDVRQDVPLSFISDARRFHVRKVTTSIRPVPLTPPKGADTPAEFDALLDDLASAPTTTETEGT